MLCFWADFPNLLPPRNPWNNFQVSGSVHDMLNGIDFHWSCSHICGASEMWKKKKKVLCVFWAPRCDSGVNPGSLSSMETLLNHTCVQDFSTNCSPRRWHLLLTMYWPALKLQLWPKSSPEPCKFASKVHLNRWTNACCYSQWKQTYNLHRTCVNPASGNPC